MFERFTAQSRGVIVDSQTVARRLHDDHIGTEHLLLALVAGSGSAADVAATLASLGLTESFVQERVGTRAPEGEAPSADRLPFTEQAKKSIELSLREALGLRSNHIGPEHLALGLTRVKAGPAMEIFRAAQLTPDEVHSALLRSL